MAMSVGGGKGPSANMNVTPMIDVLLVLIIIFMLITPFAPTGEKVLIPQPPDPHQAPPPEIVDSTVVLQLTANAEGHPSLKLNQDEVGWDDLKSRLQVVFSLRKQKVIFLKAYPKLDWEEVAQVIDVVHTAGISNVGLITETMR